MHVLIIQKSSDQVYENLENYYATKKKVSIVLDDMIADMKAKKIKLYRY